MDVFIKGVDQLLVVLNRMLFSSSCFASICSTRVQLGSGHELWEVHSSWFRWFCSTSGHSYLCGMEYPSSGKTYIRSLCHSFSAKRPVLRLKEINRMHNVLYCRSFLFENNFMPSCLCFTATGRNEDLICAKSSTKRNVAKSALSMLLRRN